MLLVDDHEAQVPELHVRLNQLVRADHEIDRPGGDAVECRLDFLRRAESRQLGQLHGPFRKAVGEYLEVLLGEQRGRHQQRHLLAVGDGDECGAQRDLGLAEADVAAHQPVHRLARRQVLDHRLDRRLLVGRFLEGKAFGERLVVVRLERERVSLPRCALRVEVEKLRRRVVRALGRLAFRFLPLSTAELVQRRGFGRRAAVATDQMQARHRHVELGVVRVDQLEKLGFAVADVERGEAEIAADPVLLVDDGVADAHFREIADHRVDVRASRGVAACAPDDVGVELRLGDEGEPRRRPDEAGGQRRDDERELGVARRERGEVVEQLGLQSVLGEILLHRFAAARAFGGDQHPAVEHRDRALERDQRIVGTPVDLHRRQAARRRVHRLGGRGIERFHDDAAERLQEPVELIACEEQLVRREQRACLVAAQ